MKIMRKEIILVVLLGSAISLFACSSTNSNVTGAAPITQAASPVKSTPYVIQPGDQLDIKFFYNPELNETLLTVRPDGMISLQLIDEVQAAGKSPAELDKYLTDQYARELRKPMVTVIVRSFAGQRIYVGGEVKTEGMIDLPAGLTPLQAVFQAGGFEDTADPASAIVIRKGSDNRPVPVYVNLKQAMQGQGDAAQFQLQANDVVYVPKSAIAQANLFVNQYIERLFLIRGVSMGFSYRLDNKGDN